MASVFALIIVTLLHHDRLCESPMSVVFNLQSNQPRSDFSLPPKTRRSAGRRAVRGRSLLFSDKDSLISPQQRAARPVEARAEMPSKRKQRSDSGVNLTFFGGRERFTTTGAHREPLRFRLSSVSGSGAALHLTA